MNEVYRALVKMGIPGSRITTAVSGELVRDDGHMYLPKTLFRGHLYFTPLEYSRLRSKKGEVIVLDKDGSLLGSVYFWKLPQGGGKITIGSHVITVILPIKKGRHTTVAISPEDRFLVEEIRGELERMLRLDFPNLGSLLAQSLSYVAAQANVMPYSVAVRVTRYDMAATCPNCKHIAVVKSERIALMVDCVCGLRFVAIRKMD